MNKYKEIKGCIDPNCNFTEERYNFWVRDYGRPCGKEETIYLKEEDAQAYDTIYAQFTPTICGFTTLQEAYDFIRENTNMADIVIKV